VRRKPKDLRDFELAVARFAAAMDRTAVVTHDARLPDRHTDSLRQRDVWIEAKVCSHFPVSLHVSCKRYKRKLHQGDIDTFVGELVSSGAHKGVLYSYSGFGQSALKKAQAVGICCCRLFQNRPADIPMSLAFTTQYCCSSQFKLSVTPDLRGVPKLRTWGDILGLPLVPPAQGTALDALATLFRNAEQLALKANAAKPGFPPMFAADLHLPATDHYPELLITVYGGWRVFRSRQEFVLLNGSYSHSTGDFAGEVHSPWIDRQGTEPGPGWELLASPPQHPDAPVVAILYAGDIRAAMQTLIPRPIRVG